MQSLKQTEVGDLLRITQKAKELVTMVTTLQALLPKDGPNLTLSGPQNTGNVWSEKHRKPFVLEQCPVMGRDQQRCPSSPLNFSSPLMFSKVENLIKLGHLPYELKADGHVCSKILGIMAGLVPDFGFCLSKFSSILSGDHEAPRQDRWQTAPGV